ncbi:MAG: endonuclease/exonuclease/phosphatase family protein [Anaerolineae bacterium]|nr:endonuclease/exonuclease/phosphatase family protein [Anaerolineae bacterium]
MAKQHHPVVRFVDATFTLIVGLYGLGTLAFLILRTFVGDGWWPIALYNSIGHLLWLPAFGLVFICLFARKWLLTLLMFFPVAAFIMTYAWALPKTTDLNARGTDVTIMTFNILHRDGDYQDRAQAIRESGADIVAVQELDQAAAARFQQDLIDIYPYQALYPERWYAGQGILSKIPFEEMDYWRSEVIPNSFGYQRAVVNVGGYPVTIYNLHLLHPMAGGTFFDATYRQLEVTDVLQRTLAEEGRVVMVGDFNMNDLSDDYRRITEHFSDAQATLGGGLGWSWGIRKRDIQLPPMIRLDYVFYNHLGIRPLDIQVMPNGGSDHHPVRVTMDVYDPTLSYPD